MTCLTQYMNTNTTATTTRNTKKTLCSSSNILKYWYCRKFAITTIVGIVGMIAHIITTVASLETGKQIVCLYICRSHDRIKVIIIIGMHWGHFSNSAVKCCYVQ